MNALSLRHLFDLYYRHKLALGSPHTRYQYDLNLRRFGEFLGREPMLTDLRDDTVTEAIGWLMHSKKLSAGSASKFRDCVTAAWRFGSRKRIEGITSEPDVPDVREPRRIPVAWSRQELAALWAYLKRLPGELDGVPASDWFCSLHAVLWDSGARIGEALQLEWPQVDLAGGWVIMRAETRKGRLSDKLSRLHPSTVELLDRIRWPERRRVWPWPYNPLYLWRVYGDILKRAGLPAGRERKFHCLRKSCATHLTALAGEGAAQSAMGHSDLRMTRDVYVDPRYSNQKFPSHILPRLDDPDGRPAA